MLNYIDKEAVIRRNIENVYVRKKNASNRCVRLFLMDKIRISES